MTKSFDPMWKNVKMTVMIRSARVPNNGPGYIVRKRKAIKKI